MPYSRAAKFTARSASRVDASPISNAFKRFMAEEDRIGYLLLFCAFFCINMTSWGSLAILGFLGFNALYIIRNWQIEDLTRLKRNLFLFTFVAAAFLSFMWSQYRGSTLRASFQLAITVFIGIFLGSSKDPAKIIFPIARSLLLYVAFSLIFGKIVSTGVWGETGLTGIGGGAKNFFSDSASTCLLLSLGCAGFDLFAKRYLKASLILFIIPICVIALWRSNSAGGIIMCAAASALFVYLIFQARIPTPGKLIGLVTLISCAVFILAFKDEILEMIYSVFHKNSTLTGRVYLWYRASFYTAERPLLGVGYYAFWQPSNVEAQGLWDYAGIKSRMGFNFHNTYIHLMVDMGYFGLTAFLAPMFYSVVRYCKIIFGRPQPLQLAAFSFIACEMSKSGLEYLSPIPFSSQTVFMFICLSMSVAGANNIRALTPPIWRRMKLSMPARRR